VGAADVLERRVLLIDMVDFTIQADVSPAGTAARAAGYTACATVVGLVMFAGYALTIEPFFSECHGGASDSFSTAGLIGVALALAGLVASVTLRRWLLPFVLFAAVYPIALALLAGVAPIFWGDITCTHGSD